MEHDRHAEDMYLQAAQASATPWNSTKSIGRVPMHGMWSLLICRVGARDGREYIEIQAWRQHPDRTVSPGRQRLVVPVERVADLVALLVRAALTPLDPPSW